MKEKQWEKITNTQSAFYVGGLNKATQVGLLEVFHSLPLVS